MALADLPSTPCVSETERLPSAPVRESSWLLVLGIVLFACLLAIGWAHVVLRPQGVSEERMRSARSESYQVENRLYQQINAGKRMGRFAGQLSSLAKRAGDHWRYISVAGERADAQARRKHLSPRYGRVFVAKSAMNAAALYGVSDDYPRARVTMALAIARDPADASAYRQLSLLYASPATPIVFSPATETLLRDLSTGPLFRARNAQLNGDAHAALLALLPGERAARRRMTVAEICWNFIGGVVLAVFIFWLSYRRRITHAMRQVAEAPSVAPPWGIGAALIAISAVFLSTWLMNALLVNAFHVWRLNERALLPMGGAVELICAVIVFGVFLALYGKHPFAWSEFGWHTARARLGYGLATLFLLYPVIWLCTLFSSYLFRRTSDNPIITALERSTNPWIVLTLFVLAVVIAPLVEETLFRGILFPALGARLPFWWAAIISGALFAIGHGELVVILPFTLLGVTFAFLARRTGNLWPSAAAHGAFNAIASMATLLITWSLHGPGY
jgi:membrane protease YdiL (CAAX protease family)